MEINTVAHTCDICGKEMEFVDKVYYIDNKFYIYHNIHLSYSNSETGSNSKEIDVCIDCKIEFLKFLISKNNGKEKNLMPLWFLKKELCKIEEKTKEKPIDDDNKKQNEV